MKSDYDIVEIRFILYKSNGSIFISSNELWQQ